MEKLGEQTRSNRGFTKVEFTDSYDKACSLQASSLANHEQPGTSAIWLGISGVEAQVMHRDAAKVGVKTNQKSSWVPFPIPDEVLVTTRMHLERDKVQALVNHLQAWLNSETGEFKVEG